MDPELLKMLQGIRPDATRVNTSRAGAPPRTLVQALLTLDAEEKKRGETAGPEYTAFHIRQATGRDFPPAEVAVVRSQIKHKDPLVSGIVRSAAQGMTANFSDEMLGALSKPAQERARMQQEIFATEHPVLSTAAGIPAAVMNPLLRMLPFKARTAGQAFKQGAAAGGGTGAAFGAGSAEGDVGDRAGAAVTGGVVGAVVGAPLAGAMTGVKALFTPAHTRALNRFAQAIEEGRTAAPGSKARFAGRAAAEAQLKELERLGLGEEVLAADLNTQTRSLTDWAANISDDAFFQIGDRVIARLQEQVPRVAGTAQRLLRAGIRPLGKPGEEVGDAATRATQLKADTDAWARDAYGQIFGERGANRVPNIVAVRGEGGKVVELTPAGEALQRLLNQPTIRDAWAKAKKFGLIGEEPVPLRDFTFRNLHEVKRDLDDAITEAFEKRGRGQLGEDLKAVRTKVVEALEKGQPGYRDVNTEYARRMGMARGLEAGQKDWDKVFTPKDFALKQKHIMSDGGAEAVQEWRRGLAARFIQTLEKAATDKDAARKFVGASRDMQRKLQAIFGDEATFREFMDTMGAETQFARLVQALGGSATVRRGSVQQKEAAQSVLQGLATGFGSGINWIKAGVFRAAGSRVSSLHATRTAEELASMLMTQGSDDIRALIDRALNQLPVTGRMVNQQLPAAAAGLLVPPIFRK